MAHSLLLFIFVIQVVPPSFANYDYLMPAQQWPKTVCMFSRLKPYAIPISPRFSIHGLYPTTSLGTNQLGAQQQYHLMKIWQVNHWQAFSISFFHFISNKKFSFCDIIKFQAASSLILEPNGQIYLEMIYSYHYKNQLIYLHKFNKRHVAVGKLIIFYG